MLVTRKSKPKLLSSLNPKSKFLGLTVDFYVAIPVFRRGPYLDVTNSRKSLFDVPMMDTGKLPTPQN